MVGRTCGAEKIQTTLPAQAFCLLFRGLEYIHGSSIIIDPLVLAAQRGHLPELLPGVKHGQAVAQPFKGGARESGGRHVILDLLRSGKDPDGFGQIVKRRGRAGDQPAGPGQDAKGIELIETAKPGGRGNGEFHGHAFSSGFEDAVHLPQSLVQNNKITDAVAHDDRVETVPGKSHLLRIPLDPLDVVLYSGPGGLAPADAHHGSADIADHHLSRRSHGFGGRNGEITGAAAQVQDPVAAPQPQPAHRPSPPEKMQPEAEHRVRQVVAPGNGLEMAEHQAALFTRMHFLEPVSDILEHQALLSRHFQDDRVFTPRSIN